MHRQWLMIRNWSIRTLLLPVKGWWIKQKRNIDRKFAWMVIGISSLFVCQRNMFREKESLPNFRFRIVTVNGTRPVSKFLHHGISMLLLTVTWKAPTIATTLHILKNGNRWRWHGWRRMWPSLLIGPGSKSNFILKRWPDIPKFM